MNWKPLGVALAMSVGLARAQTGTARPEFEVTSVKPNHTGCCTTYGAGNGRSGGKDVTLKILIAFAYRIQQFQVSGGPRWIDPDRFDVDGKAEDLRTDPDQLRLMLQSLFEDRFKLKVHRETKPSAVYALVVGKGGPKIKLSRDQNPENVDGPSPPRAGPNHGETVRELTLRGHVTPEGHSVTLLPLKDQGDRFALRPFDADLHGAIRRKRIAFEGNRA